VKLHSWLRCIRRSRTRLGSLKELLLSQLVPVPLFDHLSVGVQGVPKGLTELHQERDLAFQGAPRVALAVYRYLRTLTSNQKVAGSSPAERAPVCPTYARISTRSRCDLIFGSASVPDYITPNFLNASWALIPSSMASPT
jgi:hypothetical protein